MENRTQSRKWLLTFNNPEKYDMGHDNIRAALSLIKNIDYWCMCDEVGENGTYHTHLFLFRRNPMRFSMVKNRFPAAHIDYCRGTTQENRDYVRKEGKHRETDKAETNLPGTFEEYGECPVERQGERADIGLLYAMVKDGMSNYDILESNPGYMLQIDKVERCRQIVREEQFRDAFRELSVEYWYGETGRGKTRTVMEQYGYGNVYRVTNYRYPFDGYAGQDVIVFEEFYDSLRIQDMLTYLDGYPLELPCRYNNKIACYTKVYILSNVAFDEQYRDVFREFPRTFEAFERRIGRVRQFLSDRIVDYDSVADYRGRRMAASLEEECLFTERYRQEKMSL